jgi:hypothetical protein
MLFLSAISLFLPALNRESCQDSQNGYTCSDLDSGLAKLNSLISRPRTRRLRFIGDHFVDSERLLTRVFAVSYALATGSTPVLPAQSQFSAPSIADVVPESGPSPHAPPPFPFCDNGTLPPGDASWRFDASPAHLLFNPALAQLYAELGPAALHILMHYTLNLTSPLERSADRAIVGTVECGEFGGPPLAENARLPAMLHAAGAAGVAVQLPSLVGFLVGLIRGEAPTLYDAVGRACWRARSYVAGGVNPLYPGAGRSPLDLAR